MTAFLLSQGMASRYQDMGGMPAPAPSRRGRIIVAKSVSKSASDSITRASAKMLNRTDLTRRLIGVLKHDEAVVAGIGNTNFDL